MRIHRALILIASYLIAGICALSQTTVRAIPTEIEMSEGRISQVIARAEHHFREGKRYLEDNKRVKAREEFDRAIDTILESGFDVRASTRLQTFYLELVERIYSEEVPLPNRPVNADMAVATQKAVRQEPRKNQIGFREQQFEASSSDELSKPIVNRPIRTTRSTGSSSNQTLSALRREFVASTKEYRASLEKLLAIYADNVRKAEAKLAQTKVLYANGMILENQLDDAARLVDDERAKVTATRRRIAAANAQIAQILNGSHGSISAPGPRPSQLANGQVPAVIRYLNDNLNDPYSMKLLRWSKLRLVNRYDQPFWHVTLRMRAKNGFGAYILREVGFYLRNHKVVFTEGF